MRLVPLLAILWIPATAFAYGEPDEDGVPNRYERLLHVFTNQIRQAPHEWDGWDTSLATPEPRPPLAHEGGLSTAARFHADDMKGHGCFQHESCDGTTFEARVSRYFDGGGSGENIYMSFGDKSERGALDGWMNSEGHRINILRREWTHLGAGEADSGGSIWYVQDFGAVRPAAIPMIPAAAWEPRGQKVGLHANFFHDGGKSPREVSALVDGRNVPLVHAVGEPGNETWTAEIDTPDECVELYFSAKDDDGEEGRYPSTGALLIGPGCSSEFIGTVAPRPDRPIVDADQERGGCTATHTGRSGGGMSGLLALAFGLSLLALRRRC